MCGRSGLALLASDDRTAVLMVKGWVGRGGSDDCWTRLEAAWWIISSGHGARYARYLKKMLVGGLALGAQQSCSVPRETEGGPINYDSSDHRYADFPNNHPTLSCPPAQPRYQVQATSYKSSMKK